MLDPQAGIFRSIEMSWVYSFALFLEENIPNGAGLVIRDWEGVFECQSRGEADEETDASCSAGIRRSSQAGKECWPLGQTVIPVGVKNLSVEGEYRDLLRALSCGVPSHFLR